MPAACIIQFIWFTKLRCEIKINSEVIMVNLIYAVIEDDIVILWAIFRYNVDATKMKK